VIASCGSSRTDYASPGAKLIGTKAAPEPACVQCARLSRTGARCRGRRHSRDRAGSSNRRCVERRSRLGRPSSVSRISVSTSTQSPQLGEAGCHAHYLNSVSCPRMILRTVARDTDSVRTISLIGTAPRNRPRRISPIFVHANHPRQPFPPIKAKGRTADTNTSEGVGNWTRKSTLRGQYCKRFYTPFSSSRPTGTNGCAHNAVASQYTLIPTPLGGPKSPKIDQFQCPERVLGRLSTAIILFRGGRFHRDGRPGGCGTCVGMAV